ncbi:hypothetical protein [Roseofilum casamattae]|uniref:Sulfotransferase n=1 Tax=Roseofilum casamattae BLCC-M143 TaxID=3022442 RepID=A0ABT7C1W5_9CYAN|nr:hypothetical protein [Roseofilum casamattae]MDJ1184686.1 hypothetical protein [Roseofilum casamattae BLCC-M143]
MKKLYRNFLDRLELWNLAWLSLHGAWEERQTFSEINTYCMFLGYPRSGHSLVGGLIDAHPNAIVGNELNALKYIQNGFNRWQIYYLLLEYSRFFYDSSQCRVPAKNIPKGRAKYQVPNQYNGKFTTLTTIGDKRGGGTTRMLSTQPELLQYLRDEIALPIKFIHVVRNPYDNISTILRKNPSKTMQDAIDAYFILAETNEKLLKKIDNNDVFQIALESFIANPQGILEQLLSGFLNLPVTAQYLQDCSNIVFASPNKSRFQVDWNDDAIAQVQQRLEQISFLNHYSYDR